MTDISRTLGKHKKRNVSVMAIPISVKDMAAAGVYEVAVLPKNILITASTLVALIPFDGTTPTIEVEYGAVEVLAATAIDAVANTVVAGNGDLSIQSGPVLFMTKVGTSTVGEYMFTMEYIEYEQATGELTNFVDA